MGVNAKSSNRNTPACTNTQSRVDRANTSFCLFRYLLLIGQSLLLICQTLLLALDEGLNEFRMCFLQVANFLQ